jgi:hypothetical protein
VRVLISTRHRAIVSLGEGCPQLTFTCSEKEDPTDKNTRLTNSVGVTLSSLRKGEKLKAQHLAIQAIKKERGLKK